MTSTHSQAALIRGRPWTVLAAAFVMAVLAPGGVSGQDPRIDPETGRDRAVYPPARHFDHLHMRLEIDLPTMAEAKLTAVQTLTVSAIGSARSELTLHAEGLAIRSVTVDGRAAKYAHEGQLLKIRLPRALERGAKADVVIAYSCDFSGHRGTGLTWSPGREDADSETDRAPQIHSQGQPEHNRSWFPCHDFPNERLTTELIVTVEDGFQVCSNGRLIGTRRAPGGRTVWHWLQDKPHANYLVLLVVGKFAIVGLDASDAGLTRAIPVYLYTPIGSERTAKAAYAQTPKMLAFFERYFDEPYPWDKYAQLLVRGFAAGGMENTTATTMQAGSAYARPGSQDDVIAHEACHQWLGDLITCKSWEHLWLNEGWASMGEALWAEHAGTERGGAEAGRRAYQRKIAGFVGMERALNRTYAPTFPGMVSNLYNDPMQTFIRANNVYAKGAIVLHMLRARLGDETFALATQRYIDRFKFREVETDDFRRVLEEISGESLEQFFVQWALRPGLPRLDVELDWDEGTSRLTVRVIQTQRIDADNPAYALRIPLYARFEDGTGEYVYLWTDSRSAEASFALAGRPSDVRVDPNFSIAAVASIRKPLAQWIDQLQDPSLFMQVQATEHLARFQDEEARGVLARLAADQGADELVRASAAGALTISRLAAGASGLCDLAVAAADRGRTRLALRP